MRDLNEIKELILKADIIASEVIRQLYNNNEINEVEVKELLEWSGDDDYVTVDDIINDHWCKLVQVEAEGSGWYVKQIDDYWCFSKSSPANQDCSIEINASTLSDLQRELENFANNFDVSSETYLWLDHDGHGINGAPYDMKDVYEDMEWFKNEAEVLAESVRKISEEE